MTAWQLGQLGKEHLNGFLSDSVTGCTACRAHWVVVHNDVELSCCATDFYFERPPRTSPEFPAVVAPGAVAQHVQDGQDHAGARGL